MSDDYEYRNWTDALPVAVAYVRLPGNVVGGNLHIALDDENLDDHSLSWCRGYADAKDDHPGSLLAAILYDLDVVDRVRLYDALGHQRDYTEHADTERDFWLVVEAGPYAGWGGIHEESITGYKRPT